MTVSGDIPDELIYHLETHLFVRLLPAPEPQFHTHFKVVA